MLKSFLLASALAMAGAATAQDTADPVKAAYHDYVVARDKGDLSAAEAAGARALAASEARDGAGASTAVLALNLAMVRLDLKHYAEAVAPARRAVELANAGAKGVDPVQAGLTLAEAELTANPKGDESAAANALQAADIRMDLDDFAYPAAVALAKAAVQTHQWRNEVSAWSAAAVHARGAHSDTDMVRGRALTQEAIAFTNLRQFDEAHARIGEALPLLAKYAPESGDYDKVTIGEFFLADAIALDRAINVLEPRYSRDDGGKRRYVRKDLAGSPAVCGGRVEPHPMPTYPDRSQREGEIGAVVLRLKIDASGKVIALKALSTVINPDFRKAVEDPKLRWSWSPDTNKNPGCRVETQDLWVPVVFSFSG